MTTSEFQRELATRAFLRNALGEHEQKTARIKPLLTSPAIEEMMFGPNVQCTICAADLLILAKAIAQDMNTQPTTQVVPLRTIYTDTEILDWIGRDGLFDEKGNAATSSAGLRAMATRLMREEAQAALKND